MKRELLRLKLQFFAGEIKEEEDEVIIPGEEGVTGASGVTGSTPPAYNMPQNTVAAPVAQDFDTWYKANGGMDEAGYYAKYDLDPDRDYQNTVNTLNYEYQTSMANYGEQAEKMYQMGLQNSGVSDIFQANAFSSYLGNMNQAAADRITARKKNKAAFEDYVAGMKAQHGQYETGIKTEYDTKLNSALASALEIYNGYNLDSVLSQLGVAGYYTEIVQAVGEKLSGMDEASIKALKAETEGNLAQSILAAFPNLTEADRSAVNTMFGGMVPDAALDAAFNRALTTYQSSAAGQTAAVNNFVTTYGEQFDPNMSKDDFVNNMITKEDGTLDESQRANAEAAWEQMKADWDENIEAATRRAEELYRGATYTVTDENGNKVTKQYVKGVIEKLIKEGYSKAVANAAAQKLIGQDPTIYKERAGKQAYADAMSRLGIEGVDLTKYSSWDAYKTAITNSLQGTDWSVDSVNYAIQNAKNAWNEAKASVIAGGVDTVIEYIDEYGESYVKSQLLNAMPQDMVDEVWKQFLTTPMGEQWQGTLRQASVDELVNTWTASFDPNMSKEEFVTKMITGEDGKVNEDLRANAEAAWEQMNGQFLNNAQRIAESVTDRSLINSKSDDNVIKGLIENAGLIATPGLIKAVRDELAKGDNFNESVANDLATKDVETANDNLSSNETNKGYNSIKDYFTALDNFDAIDAQYGNTGATDPDRENINNTVNTIITSALSGSGGDIASSDTARTLEGIISNTDIQNWGNLSDDERRRAVLEGTINSGRFSVSEIKNFVSDYVNWKTKDIISTDKDNAKASGLADAGDLVMYVKGLGLGSNATNNLIKDIVNQIGFEIIGGGVIKWNKTVGGAEASIYGWEKNKKINDTNLMNSLESQFEKVKYSRMTVYNGKLYGKNQKNEWFEIPENGVTIAGDGHTNTDAQAKGIYHLLVVMFEQGDSNTVRPGGTGGIKDGVITDDKTGGGRTKDFSTTNK